MPTALKSDPDLSEIRVELARLQEEAEKAGVEIECSLEKLEEGIVIWLGNLVRHTGPAGSGGQILEELCSIADEHDLTIQAAVTEWNSRLIEFYAAHGFEKCDGHGSIADLDDDFVIISRLALVS